MSAVHYTDMHLPHNFWANGRADAQTLSNGFAPSGCWTKVFLTQALFLWTYPVEPMLMITILQE